MRAVPVVLSAILVLAAPAAAGVLDLAGTMNTITERLPHPPILIDEDADFCAPGSGVRNCDTADGSAAAPYRISGWSISASGDIGAPAITIRGTTKHVVLEDNGLRAPCTDTVPAVELHDAAHVTLQANDLVSGLSSALVATGVTDLALAGNDFLAACADLTGVPLVSVDRADGAAFTANVYGGVAGNESALHADGLVTIADATRVNLTDNIYENAQGTALTLTRVSVDNASGEWIRSVRYGLDVTQGGNLTFFDFAASGVEDAITVTDTSSFTLKQASLADNWPCDVGCLPIGITVTNSRFTGEYLTLSGFQTGVLVQDPHGNTTSSDDCDASDDDAWDECEWTARIRYANITGNAYAGVVVEDRAKAYVGKSDIHGNGAYGVASNSTKLVLAHKDWWGCSKGPGHEGCDDVTPNVRTPATRSERWGW